MIVSANLKKSNSRWLQASVLLCALAVLPLGLACTEKNAMTGPAVLTEEANTLLATIGTADAATVARYERFLAGMRLRLRKGVEEGKLTEEEARLKMAEFERGVRERIRIAKSGGMTREDSRLAGQDRDDGIDWNTVKATAPEEWPDELKARIVAAGYDLDKIAERVRRYQQDTETRTERVRDDGVDWNTVKATAPEEWSDELKAQIVAAGYDLEQIAERVRRYQQAAASEGR